VFLTFSIINTTGWGYSYILIFLNISHWLVDGVRVENLDEWLWQQALGVVVHLVDSPPENMLPNEKRDRHK